MTKLETLIQGLFNLNRTNGGKIVLSPSTFATEMTKLTGDQWKSDGQNGYNCYGPGKRNKQVYLSVAGPGYDYGSINYFYLNKMTSKSGYIFSCSSDWKTALLIPVEDFLANVQSSDLKSSKTGDLFFPMDKLSGRFSQYKI